MMRPRAPTPTLELCNCGLDVDRCCRPHCPSHEIPQPPDPEVRIVVCEACQGEGRDIRIGTVYEPGCGHPHHGEVDRGPCEVCNGAGHIEVVVS